jgi:PD-(D/E)XK nuclease superfamily protein
MNAIGLAPVVRLRLSASQVQTFVNCQRAWAWKYVEGVEEPSSPAAEKGKQVHAVLEQYLTGGQIDFTTEIGYIAASGLQHLPQPGTWVDVEDRKVWVPAPGLLVEQEFHFVGPSGHSYLGYKDLETDDDVYDHKTTSDLRWQKTEEELRIDIQATLYAVDHFRKHPDKNEVKLHWVYYQTKNAKKSAVTRLRVQQDETWQRFLEIEKIADQMAVAATKQPLELPPSINHCSAYGGCPHQGRCNLSPFDRMRSHVEQNKLLASLSLKKANGAAAVPPPAALAAPPPVAAPAAVPANQLLARMRAAGAPAAMTPAAAPPVPTEVPAATGPAINPPEYQPPPIAPPPATPPPAAPPPVASAAPPVAALTPAAASAELAQSLQEPAGAEATRGRGRPKTGALPATNVAVKIKTLYVNCGPVGLAVVDAAQLITLAKQRIAAVGVADYRFAEYGQGPGMLALAVVEALDAVEGVIASVRLDTNTPEGQIVAVELMARAGLVVR